MVKHLCQLLPWEIKLSLILLWSWTQLSTRPLHHWVDTKERKLMLNIGNITVLNECSFAAISLITSYMALSFDVIKNLFLAVLKWHREFYWYQYWWWNTLKLSILRKKRSIKFFKELLSRLWRLLFINRPISREKPLCVNSYHQRAIQTKPAGFEITW